MSDQVFSITNVFLLEMIFFVRCAKTGQQKSVKFGVPSVSGNNLFSLAVKNNVHCHAKLSSRASFPDFPIYHSQGLQLSPLV